MEGTSAKNGIHFFVSLFSFQVGEDFHRVSPSIAVLIFSSDAVQLIPANPQLKHHDSLIPKCGRGHSIGKDTSHALTPRRDRWNRQAQTVDPNLTKKVFNPEWAQKLFRK